MKKSNKLVIISACLFLVSFSLVLSAFLKESPGGNSGGEAYDAMPEEINERTLEAENNISDPISHKTEKNGYVIRISDGKICAFIKTDGSEILWSTFDIPLDLSHDEKKILEEGIQLKSFEEMCLYLESYAS